MKQLRILSLWLLLFLGTSAIVFSSCEDDNEPKQEQTNPDDGSDPDDDIIAVSAIRLDSITLSLSVGEEQTLTATVLPEDSDNATISWTSSDSSIATVSNGLVSAISVGSAVITAQAGDKTATCSVSVTAVPVLPTPTTDPGVVINGVKWSTRNVDSPGTFAETPESPGMFYQWNRKVAWSATGETVEGWDNSIPEGTEWTATNDPSPAGWRVPTLEEIQSLLDEDKVRNEWTTQNSVTGRMFIDKETGASLFLPAAGFRDYEDGRLFYSWAVNGTAEGGGYWISTQVDSYGAYSLTIRSAYADWYELYRSYGHSVRCVAE